MDVLKVLILIVSIALVFAVYTLFNNKCLKSTGYPLLMDTTIFGFALAGWIVYIGIAWRSSLIKSGGDVLNGTLIAVCGGCLMGYFIFKNYRQLGAIFGTMRTVMQVIFLPASMPLTFLYPFWAIWKRMRSPEAVYVVNND